MMPRWMGFCYLTVVVAAIISTFGMGAVLLQSQAQVREYQILAGDRLTQRDSCWKLYSDDEEKLRWFQDSCRGMNCNEVFSNDAAGVVTATYTDRQLNAADLSDFCRHDERVNLGENYPGAKLIAFGVLDTQNKEFPAKMVHCDWTIPSKTWCQKE